MGQIAAIYCRVSTQDQNCDRQERDLLAYADRCGYKVRGVYKETESGMRRDRLERQKILALARDRSINIILVSELTRWGRSTPDLINSLNDLQIWGVSLIAQSGFQFDLATPHGKLIAGVMSSMAEFERDLLVERVRSGLCNAKARGKILGRPRVNITDRCDRVNDLRSSGLSDRAIARKLSLGKSSISRCPRCVDLPEGMDW